MAGRNSSYGSYGEGFGTDTDESRPPAIETGQAPVTGWAPGHGKGRDPASFDPSRPVRRIGREPFVPTPVTAGERPQAFTDGAPEADGAGGMNGICGLHLGGADGVGPMLDALAGYGTDGVAWTEPAGEREADAPVVALGVRWTPEPGKRRAGASFRIDRGGGFAVAADARLDDRGALCDALGVPRAERAGLDDRDLIARAWARWGRDCPGRLLGDYAFAVWDRRARILFCARDHIGARPFYYARTAHGFAFASAVEAVLAAPGVDDRLDEGAVATWLVRRNLLTNTRTFFEKVRKLPPGHALTVAGAAPPRLHRYWRPERAPRVRRASDDAYAEELLDLYARAVRDRLRGPDPVGAHLSGGLDSSTLVVLAARELRREGRPPPLAYTALPPRERQPAAAGAPEYDVMDAVCAGEGLRLFHHFEITLEDRLAVFRSDGVYPGRWFSEREASIQRQAAEHGVRVLLSGWGGDECVSFNGRGLCAHLLLGGRWLRLAAECRARGWGLRQVLSETAWGLLPPRLVRRLRRPSRFVRLLRRLFDGMPPPFRHSFIAPEFAYRQLLWPPRRRVGVGTRRTQLRLLQDGHLIRDTELLAASGARHGLEYRYPLLDRRLLEFALGLPPEQFRRGKWSRWLMRHAGQSLLPPDLCWRLAKADAHLSSFPSNDVFEEEEEERVLPMVRRALEAGDASPARTCYVDMPRLLASLDAGPAASGREELLRSHALFILGGF